MSHAVTFKTRIRERRRKICHTKLLQCRLSVNVSQHTSQPWLNQFCRHLTMIGKASVVDPATRHGTPYTYVCFCVVNTSFSVCVRSGCPTRCQQVIQRVRGLGSCTREAVIKSSSLVGLVRSSVNGLWHLGDGHSGCVMVSSRGFCSRPAVCRLTQERGTVEMNRLLTEGIIHTESTSKLNDLCPVLVILWSALPVSQHHHSVGR